MFNLESSRPRIASTIKHKIDRELEEQDPELYNIRVGVLVQVEAAKKQELVLKKEFNKQKKRDKNMQDTDDYEEQLAFEVSELDTELGKLRNKIQEQQKNIDLKEYKMKDLTNKQFLHRGDEEIVAQKQFTIVKNDLA